VGIHPDLKEFIALLNSHNVEYLIVGAYAFAYHARPRFTEALDVQVRSTPENASRIMQALSAFGFAGIGIVATDFLAEAHVVQLGVSPNRIDILTSLTGVPFEDAWRNKVARQLDGIGVYVLGREELIKNKTALGRQRDLADLKDLGL